MKSFGILVFVVNSLYYKKGGLCSFYCKLPLNQGLTIKNGSETCHYHESHGWCKNYNCCKEKGLNGCWECSGFPCTGYMLDKPRIRASAEFAKRESHISLCFYGLHPLQSAGRRQAPQPCSLCSAGSDNRRI